MEGRMERELEAKLTRGGQTAVLVSSLKTSKEGRREGWRARGHTDQRDADSSTSIITKDL